MDIAAEQDEHLLVAIPGNPVPDGAVAGHVVTPDGMRLRYARFPATGRPLRGTVILLHGRNECIEKYFETIVEFSGAGYECATFDWRGQGGSTRMLRDPGKGHVDDFDGYVSDLEQVFTDVILPDCRAPFHILAHSTGALVALLASDRMVNRIRRMVLASPLLELSHPPLSQRGIAVLARFLTMIGLGTMYMAGGKRPREIAPFMGNKLTSDYDRYMRNATLYDRHRELALGGPTAGWVNAATRAIDEVRDPEFIARLRIPALLVAAGADEIVPLHAVEDFGRRMRSGSCITIDGARHELMQEADVYRSPFMAAALAFFDGGAPA